MRELRAPLQNPGFLSRAWQCVGRGRSLTVAAAAWVALLPASAEAAPGTFSKSEPAHAATGVSVTPTARWTASTGASGYYVCLDTTNNSACDGEAWYDAGNVTSLVSPFTLGYSTTYYWQVKAWNPTGTTDANGGTWWSFTTMPPPPPGAFGKLIPANAATGVTPGSVTLTWQSSSGATRYEYCYNTSAWCQEPWESTTSTSKVTFLQASTTYYWQIRAVNASGTTYANGTSWWTFTTAPMDPPGAFNKSNPLSGLMIPTATSATMSWGASTGAARYEFCYNTSAWCGEPWSSTTNTSLSVTGLTAGTTYYWQIRAVNPGGTTYSTGGFWNFITYLEPPGAFSRTGPASGSTLTTPTSATLSWGTSDRATSYDYCYDTSNNSSCDGTWTSTGTTTSAALSGLTPGTTYYWLVRARNIAGNTYATGGWWSFTTSPFTKLSPANGTTLATSTTATLTWSASPGAEWYEYCVDSDEPPCQSAWRPSDGTTAAATGLTPATKYYWSVRAWNGVTFTFADNGSLWTFTTRVALPSAPSKTTPADAALKQSTHPVLQWTSSTGADSYEYCYDTSNDQACTAGAWTSVGSALSVELHALTPATTYYWQVRARNTAGTTEAAGGWWSFTTQVLPGVFSQMFPANGGATPATSATLEWETSSDAGEYFYCFDTSNDSSCAGEAWTSAGMSTRASLSGLTPHTTYYWRVMAVNAGGFRFTGWWSFTTSLPGEFGKISPPNGWTAQGASPTLSWGDSAGATRYEYCQDTTNDGACTPWFYVGMATSVALSGLNPSEPRFWQVRAVNAAGITYADLGTWWSVGGLRVSAGALHTCAARADGSAACWGFNSSGQAPPTPPAGPFAQISAGDSHTCGLRATGDVTCWGDNWYGQAPPLVAGPFTQISAGDSHTCGVRANGSIACWGDNGDGQAPSSIAGPFAQVSAAFSHTCALRSDGAIACWGDNADGRATPAAGSFRQVDAGGGHTCAVRTDGSVACWGFNGSGQATPPGGSFIQVSAGRGHTCALLTGGAITCWGDNMRGQASPAPSGPFTQVEAGGEATCAVRTEGSVACWGSNDFGQAPVVTLAPAALPAPVVGVPYSATLAASGGTAPYRYDEVEGGLPSGLALDPSSGVLSGTPSVAASWLSRIRARDANFVAGYRDYVLTVSMPPPPGAFSKVDPANGSTGVTPAAVTFTWQESAGAATYEFCADSIDNASCDSGWITAAEGSLSLTGSFPPGTTYYWQVRARNAGGTTDADGGWWAFTTRVAPPGAFGKIDPVDGTSTWATPFVTLRWAASARAASYQTCLSTTPDCLSWSGVVTSTQRTLVSLSPLTTYYWQVRAVNEAGETYADGTALWHFTTPAAPAMFGKSSPAQGATVSGTIATVSWEPSEGAIAYAYCYDTSDDGACAGPTWRLTDSRSGTIPNLAPSTTYYWQAQAINPGGITNANLDAWWSFTTAPRLQVSAGQDYTCSTRSDGTVACWGDNQAGRAAPPGGIFRQASAGSYRACGVRLDGSLACWGDNTDGRATPPAAAGIFTRVSAGTSHSCAVRTDGMVACWGGNTSGQASAPGDIFYQVAAGGNHSCAVALYGAVACWGSDSSGQATPPAGYFTQVSAGASHTCGVRTSGTVACWGDNADGQATPLAGSFTQVSAGASHTCGVRTDGAVACWGDNSFGQATPPSGTFTEVSAGLTHTCGVRADDAIVCWGENASGQAPVPSIAPAALAPGVAGVPYTATLTASGGSAVPYQFAVSEGQIPDGLSLDVTSGELAGRPAAAGSWSFTVRARDANFLAGYHNYHLTIAEPPAPTRIIGLSGDLAFGSVMVGTTPTRTLTITNTGNSTLTVTGISYPTGFSGAWTGTIAAGESQNVTVRFAPVAATTYSGTVTVSADHTSGTNTISASGTGTAPLTFTDDPLQPRVKVVKAVHLAELRVAVEALRSRYGLPPVAWTDAVLVPRVTPIKAAHLAELRAALSAVYTAAGRAAPTWTPATVVGGTTLISAGHITELRAAVALIW